jgi:hypothetical protein
MGNIVGNFWGVDVVKNIQNSFILYKNFNILLKCDINEKIKTGFEQKFGFWDRNFERLVNNCPSIHIQNLDLSDITKFIKVKIYDEDEYEIDFKIKNIQDLMWLKVNWYRFEDINDNIMYRNWECIESLYKHYFEIDENNEEYKKNYKLYETKYKELMLINNLNKINSQIIN